MSIKYNDFMVDVESTGLCPVRNHCIQAAFVAFNLDTMEVGGSIVRGFDIREREVLHQKPDPETMRWWAKQPKEVMAKIEPTMFDGVPTSTKLDEINAFIREVHDPEKTIRFWSRPATFDHRFTTELWKNYGKDWYFNFLNCFDQMSYAIGRVGSKEQYMELQPPKPEGAHDALVDCHWQIEWLRRVQNANADAHQITNCEV